MFEAGCDMASIHCLLSQIPDDLDFEKILQRASVLYKKHPPEKLEMEVIKRVQKEYVYFSGIRYVFRKIVDFLKSFFCLRFLLGLLCLNFFGRSKYKQN